MLSLFAPPLDIFTIVGGIVLGLCAVEIVLFCLGASLSKVFNSEFSPDIDHDVHLDLDLEHDFSLFHIGEVPLAVTLLSFGLFFTLTGMSIHTILDSIGLSITNLIAIPASIFSASFFTYIATSFWAKVFPNEKTSAIHIDELLGQTGTVVIGKGDFNSAVEVSAKDKYGSMHYIMTKSALKELSFQQGDKVILVEKYNSGEFGAIIEVAANVTNKTNEKEINHT